MGAAGGGPERGPLKGEPRAESALANVHWVYCCCTDNIGAPLRQKVEWLLSRRPSMSAPCVLNKARGLVSHCPLSLWELTQCPVHGRLIE